MDQAVIDLPRRTAQDAIDGSWNITGCWTKLCLKYGVIGPWKQQNLSVAFDNYALSRGPRSGPLSLADFAITMLMNSGISRDNLCALSGYLLRDDIREQIESLTSSLTDCDDICQLPQDDVMRLGQFLDALIETIHGVGNARAFKGLAAWAPAHVFMLDKHVRKALTGKETAPPPFESGELINRFKEIVTRYRSTLTALGARLSVEANLRAPLPAVRVLDSLIWFDWCACEDYKPEFGDWVRPNWDSDSHELLQSLRWHEGTGCFVSESARATSE